MADAADLNSAAAQAACGFEPHPRHHNSLVEGPRRFPLGQPRNPHWTRVRHVTRRTTLRADRCSTARHASEWAPTQPPRRMRDFGPWVDRAHLRPAVSVGVGTGVSTLGADQENETQVSSTTRSTDSWLNRRLYSSDTSSIRRIASPSGGARITSSLERSCWISPSESRHCP